MQIRCYQANNQDEVISLWQECGLIKPQNDPVRDIQRKLKVGPDLFLVGIDKESVNGIEEEKVVATVMGGYEGHRGWINYLAVHPTSQRQGYGQQMMAAVERLLTEKGCPKINLQVRDTNQKILSFYYSIGYGDDNVVSLGKRLAQDT